MKNSKNFLHHSLRITLSLLLLMAIPLAGGSQTQPDFSGLWKQDNDRCQPKRSGNVTLRIEHHGQELRVETSILRGSQTPRRALQRYTTDGKVSVSMGTDGDEFHTSAVWKNSELFFSIEEHEDGRILLSKETWSLLENDASLRRIRQRRDGERQVLLYRPGVALTQTRQGATEPRCSSVIEQLSGLESTLRNINLKRCNADF